MRPLFLAAVFPLALLACAHRWSEDRTDWVGPRDAEFDADFGACREHMEAAPWRFGGDRRLIFLDCMEKRGWQLKGRS